MHLNTERFLALLAQLSPETWTARKDTPLIHLNRQGSDTLFSPLTAVYYHLTGIEIHRGSFWVEELTRDFGFCRWEILQISYAWSGCDFSFRYDRNLRRTILKTLNLPLDKDN
jgi:hypothetical protein